MQFSRVWAMPSKDTFTIKPIRELLQRYVIPTRKWADPFCGGHSPAQFKNDLDPLVEAESHKDALEFLREFKDGALDGVLFDPPYSPRQVSECYHKLGMTVNTQTTQSSFWANLKKEIARSVRGGGIVISCGWNSGGVGKALGFVPLEILMVCHGGWHNDTIVVVEQKEVG